MKQNKSRKQTLESAQYEMEISFKLRVQDENYLTSIVDAQSAQSGSTSVISSTYASAFFFAQFGASRFSKSINYMRLAVSISLNQVSSSANVAQFKKVCCRPCTAQRLNRISRRHFKFLTVVCLTPTTLRKVTVPKSKGNGESLLTLTLISVHLEVRCRLTQRKNVVLSRKNCPVCADFNEI